jgi:hypothetical protein
LSHTPKPCDQGNQSRPIVKVDMAIVSDLIVIIDATLGSGQSRTIALGPAA